MQHVRTHALNELLRLSDAIQVQIYLDSLSGAQHSAGGQRSDGGRVSESNVAV